jgi:osmotically-inducible protein OsmY
MIKLKPFLAVGLLLSFLVSCNNQTNDKQIQDNVTEQLQANKNYAGVTSTVKDSTVILTGMCEGDNCASDIEKNIKDVIGVRK